MRKRGDDWTGEHIGRFWAYYASRRDLRGTYFSRRMGEGMTLFLKQAGVLMGDVLDYGCGLGFLSAELLEHGVECWGCDSSAEAAREADLLLRGKRGWRGASVSTDEKAPYRSRRFDLVTCIETVEHLSPRDREAILADIRGLLRPGASLFVTTPNDEDLDLAMVYCPFCDAEFHGMQHFTSFDERSLADLLSAASFSVEYVGAVDFGEIQAKLPGLLDLSAREALRGARRLLHASYDRLTGRRFPSRFAGRGRGSKLPHLCAIARKREDDRG